MPELPEVETIKNQLLEKIVGKKIKDVDVRLPKMVRDASLVDFKKKITEAKIKNIGRRAKFLIIELNNGYSLVIHLKLTGQIIFIENCKLKIENFEKYTHIIYYFDDGSALLHNDLRQFGYVKLFKTAELDKFFAEEELGPEPLDKDFTLEKFKKLLVPKSRLKIKPLLLDQTFLAGIGNVYAQESCFCAKILPTRLVKNLKEKEISDLYNCLIKILKEAIKHKGSSVDTYVDATGQAGDYAKKLKVYGREDEKCLRCGAKIKKMTLAGRGTCYCPNCQK